MGCTYKNKEVNTDLPRGRPNSFFASSGASYPTPGGGVRPSDFEELLLCNFQEFRESDPSAFDPLPLAVQWGRLGSPGEAESGSAGVQPDEEYPGRRCADAASPWSIHSARVFLCRHRTPEPCLENPPARRQRPSPTVDNSCLGVRLARSTSGYRAIKKVAQAPIGSSPGGGP